MCDSACVQLFSRIRFAWEKVRPWAKSPREFVKRAAFALVAALAVHDKAAADAKFLALLPLIEEAASDDRNFVKKAVNWALRQIGKRKARAGKTSKDWTRIEAMNLALGVQRREVGRGGTRPCREQWTWRAAVPQHLEGASYHLVLSSAKHHGGAAAPPYLIIYRQLVNTLGPQRHGGRA